MSPFSLVPGWLWVVLLAGAALTNCVTHDRLQSEQLAHQTSKTVYAQQVANAEKVRADEEAKRRKAEQELKDGQIARELETNTLNTRLDTARGSAALASGRLRDATTKLAQQARSQSADTTPPNLGETTGDPIGVLADVLGRADERANLLADLADRCHIAGRACERQYDQAYEALKAVNASVSDSR